MKYKLLSLCGVDFSNSDSVSYGVGTSTPKSLFIHRMVRSQSLNFLDSEDFGVKVCYGVLQRLTSYGNCCRKLRDSESRALGNRSVLCAKFRTWTRFCTQNCVISESLLSESRSFLQHSTVKKSKFCPFNLLNVLKIDP